MGNQSMNVELTNEIDRNLIAFQTVVSGYLDKHRGWFAILRDQKIVEIEACLSDAIEKAHSRFADGRFSIQEITDRPIDLGFFSHAHPHG
jgi:hypothetical protein